MTSNIGPTLGSSSKLPAECKNLLKTVLSLQAGKGIDEVLSRIPNYFKSFHFRSGGKGWGESSKYLGPNELKGEAGYNTSTGLCVDA